jgi:hypothetical protein
MSSKPMIIITYHYFFKCWGDFDYYVGDFDKCGVFVCNGIPSCYLMNFINFAFTFSITTFLFMLSYTIAPELKMSTMLACIVCHYFAFLLPNDWHWDEFRGHPTKYTQFHFQYKQSLISQIGTTFIKVEGKHIQK